MEANNKAMRDALIRISELTTPCEGVTSIELQVNNIACSALADPPRNCDAFSKAEVLEVLQDRSFSKEDTVEWLYAAKGESDGSKQ